MTVEQENEKKRLELERAYKRFSKTDDGKVILEDLERFCGQNRPSASEQSPNSLQTHFNEGKRRVFLRINGFLRKEKNGTKRDKTIL